MKIAIIGAGIGGLTLALMCERQGFEVEVWEAAQTLRPLGVGINLLPHAARQLCELGLEDTLAALAIRTSALAYYNRFGQPIWHEPRGLAAGYDWPQFSIHRGEFQMALADAVAGRLGLDCIRPGHGFDAIQSTGEDGGPVRFTVRRRADDTLVASSADVLIGADGIHSAVRRHFYPGGDAPRFAGRMLWRAVTEAGPYLDGRTMFMAGHQDQKFVAYPISEPLRWQGRARINWIAELRVPDEAPPRSDWNREVDRAIFRDAFADWQWGWIDIPALIDGAQAVYEFPLVDKDPLPRWTFGRVTLLGDAAHPMYPIGSNGSAQAILDARALVDCLLATRDPGIALREYEADRLPRTAGIVLRNRLNGPEQVMQLAHERAPQGFGCIDDVIPRVELEGIAMRYKRLAGFDPQSLRDQPPLPGRARMPA